MAINDEVKKITVEIEPVIDQAQVAKVERTLKKIEKITNKKKPVAGKAGWYGYGQYQADRIARDNAKASKQMERINKAYANLKPMGQDNLSNTLEYITQRLGRKPNHAMLKEIADRAEAKKPFYQKYVDKLIGKYYDSNGGMPKQIKNIPTPVVNEAVAKAVEQAKRKFRLADRRDKYSRFNKTPITNATPVENVATTVVNEAVAQTVEQVTAPVKKKGGRPKGSKNKPKTTKIDVKEKVQEAVNDIVTNAVEETIEDSVDQAVKSMKKSAKKHRTAPNKIKKAVEKATVAKQPWFKRLKQGTFSKMFGDKPYSNSPFRGMMMYLGSAMLLQYAFMMAGQAIGATIRGVADTELQSLKGNAFRNKLLRNGGNVRGFDNVSQLWSNRTGQALYSSRAKFGDMYGKLNTRGVNTNSLDANTVVRVLRGMEFMTGNTPEQVEQIFMDLLSGKASKEQRKEFGVSSVHNPVTILSEIHATLLKNTSAVIGMNNTLLKDKLTAMANQPKEMLDMVHSNFPSIFNTITDNLGAFIDGFFDTEGGDTQKRWVALFETINRVMKPLFNKESGKSVANIVLDFFGYLLAPLEKLAQLLEKISPLLEVTGLLVARVAGLTLGLGGVLKIVELLSPAVMKLYDALKFVFNGVGKILNILKPKLPNYSRFAPGGEKAGQFATRPGWFGKLGGFVGRHSRALGTTAMFFANWEDLNPDEYDVLDARWNSGALSYEELRKRFQYNPLDVSSDISEQVRNNNANLNINRSSYPYSYGENNQANANRYGGNNITATNVYIQDGNTRIDSMMNGGM